MTKEEVENLARYLVGERRYADMLINEQCEPYPTWDEASEDYRERARVRAQKILRGRP